MYSQTGYAVLTVLAVISALVTYLIVIHMLQNLSYAVELSQPVKIIMAALVAMITGFVIACVGARRVTIDREKGLVIVSRGPFGTASPLKSYGAIIHVTRGTSLWYSLRLKQDPFGHDLRISPIFRPKIDSQALKSFCEKILPLLESMIVSHENVSADGVDAATLNNPKADGIRNESAPAEEWRFYSKDSFVDTYRLKKSRWPLVFSLILLGIYLYIAVPVAAKMQEAGIVMALCFSIIPLGILAFSTRSIVFNSQQKRVTRSYLFGLLQRGFTYEAFDRYLVVRKKHWSGLYTGSQVCIVYRKKSKLKRMRLLDVYDTTQLPVLFAETLRILGYADAGGIEVSNAIESR